VIPRARRYLSRLKINTNAIPPLSIDEILKLFYQTPIQFYHMTTMIPVASSQLESVGYDPVAGELHVAFKSNPAKVYVYKAQQYEYDQLLAAPSIGSHFSKYIKGRKFTTR
jgi:hypothetical protein